MGIEMDKTFSAANGLQVRRAENGGVEIGKPGYLDYTGPAATFALEEFLRAEHDEELGRWRCPTDPDYVVYADPDGDGVSVLNERTGSGAKYSRIICASSSAPLDGLHSAAHAFFEAHPERKPWQDAKCGDSWYLRPFEIVYDCVGNEGTSEGLWFTRANVYGQVENVKLDDPRITAGRRIWPEDAS